MSYLNRISAGLSLILLAGCANLAPLYERPAAPVPASFGENLPPASQNLTWQEVVISPDLSSLIETALSENRDLQAAAASTRIARARLDLTRSARLPILTGSVSSSVGDTFTGSTNGSASAFADSTSAQLGVSAWELDFFGRIANLTEADSQTYFATASGERALRISIAASIVETWLQLAADRELLALSEETARSQNESLSLTRQLFEAGATNELDVRRASASVQSAKAQAAQFKALVRQDTNTLRLLVGADLPAGIEEQAQLDPMPVRDNLQLGASSQILLARPDIVAAEHTLLAANANIGAARAAFFPTISLTGSAGAVSGDLDDLFSGSGATGWSFGPSISLPIFDGGARQANLEISEAQRDQALAQYEGAIQTAFRETSDALAVLQTIDERIAALEQFVEDTGVTQHLSNERFKTGLDSYLSVLDAQRENFDGRQQLILAKLDEGLNAAALYRAIGVN